MLMNLFMFWLLISVFVGSREANSFIRFMIGMFVTIWVIKIIISFGIALLPVLLVIAVMSHVVVPFVKGFMHSFDERR